MRHELNHTPERSPMAQRARNLLAEPAQHDELDTPLDIISKSSYSLSMKYSMLETGLLVVALSASPAFAQSGNSTISGSVKDPSEAAVPAARFRPVSSSTPSPIPPGSTVPEPWCRAVTALRPTPWVSIA
jgi:hypothetical protein